MQQQLRIAAKSRRTLPLLLLLVGRMRGQLHSLATAGAAAAA
jgi:hypothetical protein